MDQSAKFWAITAPNGVQAPVKILLVAKKTMVLAMSRYLIAGGNIEKRVLG
jgi:hypothetical protein